MAQVQIQKANEHDFTDFLFGRWAEHVRKIRARAHQLFEKRGSFHGHHWEDWLQAEREMNSDSTCKVEADDNLVTIVVTAPGFNANELKVSVIPGVAFLEGESEREAFNDVDRATTRERITRSFFYRIPLPEAANVDSASAVFDGVELGVKVPLNVEQTVTQNVKASGTTA